jgi:ribose-phosphate pyrophosphokinase
VYATATHGVFSGPAFERLSGPEIEEIVVTDTIPLPREAPDKIKTLSVADILARSIRSIFTDGSVSELFAGENQLF